MKAKPGIVLLFNKTKGATDSYDHLISTCDVRRKSNRYQIAVLYDMINVLITDIFIIKRMENKKLDHRKFVISLGLKQIVFDFCTECFNNINPPYNFKIFEKKSKHFRMENNDEIDNKDEDLNKLEEKEQKERKRQYTELKN